MKMYNLGTEDTYQRVSDTVWNPGDWFLIEPALNLAEEKRGTELNWDFALLVKNLEMMCTV